MQVKNLNIIVLIILVSMTITACNNNNAENAPSIIPAPVKIINSKGFFRLTPDTKIAVTGDEQINNNAQYLAGQIKYLTSLELSVETFASPVKNSIIIEVNNTDTLQEAYTLIVSKNNIIVRGSDAAGAFYGIQSLLQMVPPGDKTEIMIPCLTIEDAPAYPWRGMHLDVVRHFFPVEFVKKMLDQMAMLKLNTFHWHLTDDQGWRIEIKQYPKLTEISAWRDETMVGRYTETDQKFDGIRYGGFYTQDQIRDVIEYAQKRHITIVPEIEMPGHAVAVLAAYPEYSCTGGPFKVYTKWGISDDVFCAGKEGTFKLLENILAEVAELFPGEYIHIGGDECPKTRWKACKDCQNRIKEEGLKDEFELQSYFIKRIEKFVASKGKKIIGWDEILEGGLPERAAVMSWRGYSGGIEAAHSGHDVVMTPTGYCYFDYYQGPEDEEPLAIGGFLPLDSVYAFDPLPPALKTEAKKHILGAQANLWTEYIDSEEKAEYMIFPRLCAMAEVLWTPSVQHNYNSFKDRLITYTKRLEKYNVNYRPVKQ